MRAFTIILLLIFVGCSSIDIESVEQRTNGLTYYKGTNRLVDGTVIRRFENGVLAEKANYKSGKQIGDWFTYEQNGKVFTHGYGIDIAQKIINNNQNLNLSNANISINVEGNYQYASVALTENAPNVTVAQLLQLRNSIWHEYHADYRFKDVFILYGLNQYRFLKSDYSSKVSLDTVKTNEGLIINVR
jgi:hypothetical protein